MRHRIFEAVVSRYLREFPVVVLLGLRQAGKTTLSRALPGRTYVTLDDVGAFEAARRDPQGFLASLPRPVTIDETQRAPELLLPVKREIDRRRRAGDFLLTGSARIDLGRGARETLAGRAALLRLRPMTWSEAAGRPDWNFADALLRCRSAADVARRLPAGPRLDGGRVLAGGLPVPLLRLRGARRARWLEQYRAAYIERDVPALVRLDEVASFVRFVALAAARTAQTTNHAALAHDAGVSADTGLRWGGVLEATFVTDLLPPWFRNVGKRLVKSPKLHLGDAGLAAHLAGVRSWNDAQAHNLAGSLLETLVAQHVMAFAGAAREPTRAWHWRTHAGAEADLVLERGRRLVPIEVKASATVRPGDARGLRAFLGDHAAEAPFGVVLYGGEEAFPLGGGVVAVPVTAALEGAGT